MTSLAWVFEHSVVDGRRHPQRYDQCVERACDVHLDLFFGGHALAFCDPYSVSKSCTVCLLQEERSGSHIHELFIQHFGIGEDVLQHCFHFGMCFGGAFSTVERHNHSGEAPRLFKLGPFHRCFFALRPVSATLSIRVYAHRCTQDIALSDDNANSAHHTHLHGQRGQRFTVHTVHPLLPLDAGNTLPAQFPHRRHRSSNSCRERCPCSQFRAGGVAAVRPHLRH